MSVCLKPAIAPQWSLAVTVFTASITAGCSHGKEPPCNAGDPALRPGLERSPGEENSCPFQYSFLEIPWTEEPGVLPSMGLQRVGALVVLLCDDRPWGLWCSPWSGSLGVGHNWATSPSLFTHALEKAMATHSSVRAWRIPGTGEPSGLLSIGLHRVGHDWSDLAAAAAV